MQLAHLFSRSGHTSISVLNGFPRFILPLGLGKLLRGIEYLVFIVPFVVCFIMSRIICLLSVKYIERSW
jgi:hypothetical protein